MLESNTRVLADGHLVDYINRCSARSHQALLSEDVAKRHATYGRQMRTVQEGGKDADAIRRTITAAEARTGKRTLIALKAVFGCGSPVRATSKTSTALPAGGR